MGNHHHHHDHGHDHHHGHHHAPATFGRAFAIGITLNTAFVVVEAIYGVIAGSMALVADAGHNLSDVLGLLIAWTASVLSARPPSARFTYGLKGGSILAALANAALLWVALGAILIETLQRFSRPAEPQGMTMIVVAAMGIAVNGLSAALFARGRKGDLNLRAAFQHLLADAAVSAGVVVAGVAILFTGLGWIDPVVSLLITAVIAWGSWGLMKQALALALGAVPEGIDRQAVLDFLSGHPQVSAVHDLHIWAMSTTEAALTAHLVVPGGHPGDHFLHALAHELQHRFGIGHVTVQVESGTEVCALASDGVV